MLLLLIQKNPWARLSIQQNFQFEISETSRVQWNGTFRLHRPDPSHRAFCYCDFSAHSNTKGGGILFRVESL